MDPSAKKLLVMGRFLATKAAPYFASTFLMLVPREVAGLGTIGVTDSGFLVYDPVWLVQWKPKEVAGLWVHEALHVINRHSKRRGIRHPQKWNVAGDLAINQTVLAMGLPLPKDGMFVKDLGLPPGKTAEQYYELLPDPPKCCCGSGAGNPLPGEPAPGDPDARSEAAVEGAVRSTCEAIREMAKKRGTLPEGLRLLAESALEPSIIPWQKELAGVVREACAYTAGAVAARYDAPSRRQAGLGYGPGKAVLPRLRRPVPRVAVVVDTSSSMLGELGECLTETDAVLRAAGAEVDFVACDAAVHSIAKVRKAKDAVHHLKGGGGTDFRPAFAAVEKLPSRPNILVFLTDGYGTAPPVAPKGIRVIWALIGQSVTIPAPWGRVVYTDEKKRRDVAQAS